MLSAPIQASPNNPPVNGAGLDPRLPAAADLGDLHSVEAMPDTAAFGEQLGTALALPEPLASETLAPETSALQTSVPQTLIPETLTPELAGEGQPARAEQEQAEPNAEAWLLAMLDQQQLQLQARDTPTSAPTNPVAVKGLPAMSPVAVTVNANVVATVPAAATQPIDKAINASLTVASQSQAMAVKPGVSQDEKVREPKLAQQDQSLSDALLSPRAADSRSSDNGPNAALSAPSANAAVNTNVLSQSFQFPSQSQPQPEASLGAELASSLHTSPLGAPGASVEKLLHGLQTQLHQGQEAKWGEQLLHTLRDQVQVQIQQKIQNATIRLDPPELGSLEIYISHEAGRLSVHITASQADVARLIQHTSDRLRQELAGSNFTQVNVQTSAEGQSGQQQSRERQRFSADENILANEQPLVNTHQLQRRPGDVLVSV